MRRALVSMTRACKVLVPGESKKLYRTECVPTTRWNVFFFYLLILDLEYFSKVKKKKSYQLIDKHNFFSI